MADTSGTPSTNFDPLSLAGALVGAIFGKKIHYNYALFVWNDASYKWDLFERNMDPNAIKAHAASLQAQGKQTVINNNGVMPAPLKTGTPPASKTKWLIYAGIGVVVIVLVILLIRRRK